MSTGKQNTVLKLPSFIIGGAAKSGTTSLSRLLNAHPQIFLPDRELNFFAFAGSSKAYEKRHSVPVGSFEEYAAFYQLPEKESYLVTGEKSTGYLYAPWTEHVIININQLHPNAQELKLIFILRQPAERMFSQYVYNRNFDENLPFKEAIQAWEDRKKQDWIPAYDYFGGSFYSQAIEDFMTKFPHVRIYFFDDLVQRSEWLIADLYTYLGVNPDFVPSNIFEAENVGGMPDDSLPGRFYQKMRAAHLGTMLKKALPAPFRKYIQRKLKSKIMHRPDLDNELKLKLTEFFREDILRLQKITGRDLSNWLKT